MSCHICSWLLQYGSRYKIVHLHIDGATIHFQNNMREIFSCRIGGSRQTQAVSRHCDSVRQDSLQIPRRDLLDRLPLN
ncbi:TPA: hypothetical protein HH295_20990 [Xanthomonas vasicola pv. zeae]|nr:hypothetical protein [Xanthomonas vasicola pv. zeae]HHZ28804.1 hypothetical protein [Xanthomonas vasicola pv. zeae]HHZ33012.1 hypothetical protein [Xanthomonas vasicola pv. zeae]HHZ36891.1 hypothetical protein [Xanthomonas vasicola pv. zeae]HHZ40854.1 hypothetical protein [Xanthomonas vasicola pv. zeae]